MLGCSLHLFIRTDERPLAISIALGLERKVGTPTCDGDVEVRPLRRWGVDMKSGRGSNDEVSMSLLVGVELHGEVFDA